MPKKIPASLKPLKKMALAVKGKIKKTKDFSLSGVGSKIQRGAEKLTKFNNMRNSKPKRSAI